MPQVQLDCEGAQGSACKQLLWKILALLQQGWDLHPSRVRPSGQSTGWYVCHMCWAAATVMAAAAGTHQHMVQPATQAWQTGCQCKPSTRLPEHALHAALQSISRHGKQHDHFYTGLPFQQSTCFVSGQSYNRTALQPFPRILPCYEKGATAQHEGS